MPNGNRTTGFKRKGFQVYPQERGQRAVGSRYTHILVPTSLALTDRSALILGTEMAAMHRAPLTVLHVLPPNEYEHSMHWLDGINLLHQAARRINGGGR